MILMVLLKNFNEEILTKKIGMKKIICIDLFLEGTSDQTNIHPEMHKIFVFYCFPEIFFTKNIRVF